MACSSTVPTANKKDGYVSSNAPKELIPGIRILNKEGKRNVVLNYVQVGYDALNLGYHDIAEEYFEKALLNIETVYATGEKAAQGTQYPAGPVAEISPNCRADQDAEDCKRAT